MQNNFLNNINIEHSVNKVSIEINSHEYLNILCINVQSLRNKLKHIEDLISSFKFTIHVIVLSEIFIYSNEKNKYNLKNYDSHFSCRDNKKGGGIGVFILKSIISQLVYDLCENNNSFLKINLPLLQIDIFAVYRPPNTNIKDFIMKLDELLTNNKNKIYILGDINIDLLKITNNVNNYLDVINSNGFMVLNYLSENFATRIQHHKNNTSSKTIIDHVITNLVNYKYCLSVHDYLKFDPSRKLHKTSLKKQHLKNELNLA